MNRWAMLGRPFRDLAREEGRFELFCYLSVRCAILLKTAESHFLGGRKDAAFFFQKAWFNRQVNRHEKRMRTQILGNILRVDGMAELSASNASTFRDEARAALTPAVTAIEVDLSTTTFVDSSGLGALIALHKTMCNKNGAVRLLQPTPNVQQILELTRLHRVLEIVKN